MKSVKYLFMTIFIAIIVNGSLCFSAQKVSTLDDLTEKISGKIVLSSSKDIIVIDLERKEKDVFYLVYDGPYASHPKWGPENGSVTYFQHKLMKSYASIQDTDMGSIKINSLGSMKRSIVSDIPIFGFKGFDWSNDKRKLAYIIKEGQLNIVTNKGEKLIAIDLLTSSSEKLLYAKQPIFSLDGRAIIFLGLIKKGNPPYPMGIYEFNIETKAIRKIKEKSHISCVAISPNGEKLAYITDDGLYSMDKKTGLKKQLKQLPETFYNFCSWSPDGFKILYGYPRGFWKMKDPKLEVHMIDINTKEETVLIHKELLQQEINIRDLRCKNIDWIK